MLQMLCLRAHCNKSQEKLKCPKCLGEHTLKECLNKEAEKRCATCDSTSHYTGQAVCPQLQIQKQVDTEGH